MKKGSHHSEGAKQKSRLSHIGQKPWNTGLHRSEETKRKIRESKLGKHHSEEHNKRIKENNCHFWKGKQFSEEHKNNLSNNHVDFNSKNNPNWKDGISYEPYCTKFNNDLKERVREFFDRKCYVCDKTEEVNGERLSIHHVNYDKTICCNDIKPLFVPLCRSCHTKTHGDREGWEEFFTISLEYLTNGECFLPKGV